MRPFVTFDSEIDPAGTNALTNVHAVVLPAWIVTLTGCPGLCLAPSQVTRTLVHRPAFEVGACSVIV